LDSEQIFLRVCHASAEESKLAERAARSTKMGLGPDAITIETGVVSKKQTFDWLSSVENWKPNGLKKNCKLNMHPCADSED
jgi:hypothetical protein